MVTIKSATNYRFSFGLFELSSWFKYSWTSEFAYFILS